MTKSVAFLFFLATFVPGILLHGRGMSRLSREQKGELVDALSGLRIYIALPLVVFVAFAFGLPALGLTWTSEILVPFVLGNVLFFGIFAVLTNRRVKHLDLPPAYHRLVLTGRILQFAGLLGLAFGSAS